jgi:hypothetical protein
MLKHLTLSCPTFVTYYLNMIHPIKTYLKSFFSKEAKPNEGTGGSDDKKADVKGKSSTSPIKQWLSKSENATPTSTSTVTEAEPTKSETTPSPESPNRIPRKAVKRIEEIIEESTEAQGKSTDDAPSLEAKKEADRANKGKSALRGDLPDLMISADNHHTDL